MVEWFDCEQSTTIMCYNAGYQHRHGWAGRQRTRPIRKTRPDAWPPEQMTSSMRVGDSNIRGECHREAVVQKSFYKNKFGSYCMSRYDYLRELREAENRADWLKESYIAAQQHGCFQLAKEIDKLLEEVEQELKKLRSLR